MGAASSQPSMGLVTVTHRSSPSSSDPDLVALQRLPPVAPLMRPPTLTSMLFSRTRTPDPALPTLHPRNVSALCREYAALSRHAALPICETQRGIAKKMSAVEGLCARVLYLMALRSTELSTSAATIRELDAISARVFDVNAVLQETLARAERCEARLPVTGDRTL